MKKAFTLIELVFVVVIVSILSSVVIAYLNNDNKLDDATEQILDHIRYTQHLALIDNQYTPTPSLSTRDGARANETSRHWFKQHWQIQFHEQKISIDRCKTTDKEWMYVIFSDRSGGKFNNTPTTNEIAVDPQNPNLVMGMDSHISCEKQNPLFNLKRTYGITNVEFTHCGANANQQTIMFDNFSRPYNGYNKNSKSDNPYVVMNRLTRCLITLTRGNDKAYICVEPITGYARRVKYESNCTVDGKEQELAF